MIRIKNQQQKIKVNLPRIERTVKNILRALAFPYEPELSLLLVNERKIKGLNHKYRGIKKATDVLSFPAGLYLPLSSPGNGEVRWVGVLGDIVISMPAVLRQAKEKGINLYEELNLLLIHSILHLLGYTHESGQMAKRMQRKEREVRSLIMGRNQG